MQKVIIIGSKGGIGAALMGQLEDNPAFDSVIGLSRADMDIMDEAHIARQAERLKSHGPFDLIIVATGFLHNDIFGPEKNLSMITQETLEKNFRINAFAPMLIAKHFLPLLRPKCRAIFAALSARVGSISDNHLGGWYSYRASKAALNMLLKTSALEWNRRHKDHIILGLHPGTVDTNLSQPFQGNVAEGKLFKPEQSAQYLLDVIDQATSEDSGYTLAWDGQPIPF